MKLRDERTNFVNESTAFVGKCTTFADECTNLIDACAASSDECTTFAAVGDAVRGGGAVLMKNRDNKKSDGINTAKAVKTPDGNLIVGVSGLHSVSFAMGINRYGVATASNNASKYFDPITKQSLKSTVEGSVSNRGRLMREILECKSAIEAVKHVLSKLAEAPMEKPGMIWIVDSANIFIIEGIYNEFAVQHVTNGIVWRSNNLLMLGRIENTSHISSYCRYFRAKQLLEENYGNIDRQKLIEFSTDHQNGPGSNSICRHSKDPAEPVTVSSAIMEINRQDPSESVISVALGTPCRAWRSSSGNFSFKMNDDIGKIPKGFMDGSVYKEFIE